MERRRTNRWTGATGSVFRIIIGPAKLLASAVARSTPPLAWFQISRKENLMNIPRAALLLLLVLVPSANSFAQELTPSGVD